MMNVEKSCAHFMFRFAAAGNDGTRYIGRGAQLFCSPFAFTRPVCTFSDTPRCIGLLVYTSCFGNVNVGVNKYVPRSSVDGE